MKFEQTKINGRPAFYFDHPKLIGTAFIDFGLAVIRISDIGTVCLSNIDREQGVFYMLLYQGKDPMYSINYRTEEELVVAYEEVKRILGEHT